MARTTCKTTSPLTKLGLLTQSQICNFLNTMVGEINLDAIKPDLVQKSTTPEAKAHFDPVRRKLQVIDA